MKKAIIIGSAPISKELASHDLHAYHKIAINKSWQLRRDFDSHVFLKSLADEDHPPLASGITPVGVRHFSSVLRNAGGLYLTSGSVAMIAGYWSIARLGLSFLNYFGCDLVFTKSDAHETHFYGSGDTGPLVGNFQYNLRQRERSIRLLCWGLLHNVVVSNSSALKGTLLAFPKTPHNIESSSLLDDIFSSKETLRLVRKSGNLWAHEMRLRTPEFRGLQRDFEKNDKAVLAMHSIMDSWAELEKEAQDYALRVEDLCQAAGRFGATQFVANPSHLLNRRKTEFELVVHIGAPHRKADVVNNALSQQRHAGDRCKIVPKRDLKNYYTKLNIAFARMGEKDFAQEKRNVQIVKNFSRRIFDRLDIQAGDRVIISEENALGSMQQCAYSGRIYHSNSKFLRNFSANLPAEPAEIHVTVSSYADFFSYAYIRLLQSTNCDRYISPKVMVSKVTAYLPSWWDIIDTLPGCFPDAKIHIWCLDDEASILPSLLEQLLDTTKIEAVQQAYLSKSDFKYEKFQEILNRAGLEIALEKMQFELQGDLCKGFKIDPWTGDQREYLNALFQSDLSRISADKRFVCHYSELQNGRKLAS